MHTHQREGESRKRKNERYTCSCSASAGLGLGCWAATPLDHLSNVAFDIAHIRRKIKTLPGKLPDQFKWPFFMARTRCTRSLPCLSLSHSVCVRVCVFADRFKIWTALCFMCMKCGRCSELVHGPKNDAVRCQDNARSALVESVPMVGN